MASHHSNNVITQWVYMRSLAVVYLLAVVSLWVQIDGLIGPDGILPFGEFLEAVQSKYPDSYWWRYPTLAWVMPPEAMTLHLLLGAAGISGVMLLFGLAEGPALLGMWAFYLSISTISQIWLGYQWDTLLVETCFVSMLWARWHPYPPDPIEPSLSGLWATRWLTFRLMFSAGAVKLASGDDTWWDLTALTYHYWTQPLPNPISWYAHHLPLPVHQASVALTLAVELIVPWLIFAGYRGRQVAFVLLFLLMGGLAMTGNYGFFQLLSIVLLLSLVDDEVWNRVLPRGLQDRIVRDGPVEIARFGEIALGSIAILMWVLSMLVMSDQVAQYTERPDDRGLFAEYLPLVRPYRTVNAYGLFARMTTSRREIRFEGSRDGKVWAEFRLRYKPGDPESIPPQIAPHMPRLEWALWFAALRECRNYPFVKRTQRKLLLGSADVEGLFANNPFGDTPPRFVRTRWADYTFTEQGESAWWTVKEGGAYCPVQKR